MLAASGCDDERKSLTGRNAATLDGESIFFTALVSTSIYRFFNDTAQISLEHIESGSQFPPFQDFPSCAPGSGFARMSLTDDPLERRWRFDNFTIDCGSFISLTLNSNPDSLTETGGMYVRFEDTEELRYTIRLPMGRRNPLGQEFPTDPDGVTFTLPSQFGGGINLQMTTPNGALLYTLDSGLRHAGFVHASGTARFEDRSGGVLFVEELALEYAYDEEQIAHFAPWPAGDYEIAAFIGLGFFGSVSSFPIALAFDGAGGLEFPLEERQCHGNLGTLQNDCVGF
jgi:hypothetical protein